MQSPVCVDVRDHPGADLHSAEPHIGPKKGFVEVKVFVLKVPSPPHLVLEQQMQTPVSIDVAKEDDQTGPFACQTSAVPLKYSPSNQFAFSLNTWSFVAQAGHELTK